MSDSPIDRYENPLTSRYASAEMSALFSARSKFTTWRKLWLWLAEAEKELGLPIPEASLDALRAHLVPTEAELAAADGYERETKHDVMAHLHALGDVAPAARGVLHLGATSAFVGDNADLLLLRAALRLLATRTVRVMGRLSRFARAYRDLPCLGFTHFQAAQPTTVGKRACLWLQDLALDHRELVRRADELRFLGCKGATGTQASFVALFDGDADKAERLDRLVAQKAGFTDRLLISGQTYTRKQDALVLSALAGLAASASKFAQRRPAAPAPQGGRGAVRQEAGRLVRDALQAQPDEVRADERPRALAPLDLGQRQLDARDAVVREDARRLREPAPRARRIVPHRRLDPPPVGRRDGRARRASDRREAPPRRGAAVPGHGEHPHGRRQEGRRPAGSPREAARPRRRPRATA